MVFDPEKISLIVAGAKVTGYADGSKVSAEHNKDAVTPTTGIQGDTVYALNADRSGTIKFTLFGSSASLVRLRRLAQDRCAGGCHAAQRKRRRRLHHQPSGLPHPESPEVRGRRRQRLH